jgi:hypothetical protein
MHTVSRPARNPCDDLADALEDARSLCEPDNRRPRSRAGRDALWARRWKIRRRSFRAFRESLAAAGAAGLPDDELPIRIAQRLVYDLTSGRYGPAGPYHAALSALRGLAGRLKPAAPNRRHGVPRQETPPGEKRHVTLDQMAGLVNRSKRTLERYKTKGHLPPPDVEGGGGRPDEWLWPRVRPWLEKQFGRDLPERFPRLRP